MKSAVRALFVMLLLVASVSWCLAQDSSSDKDKSNTRTMTGCLSQANNAKGFMLTAQDGSTWDLRSDTVSLADQVNHTVKVTGVVRNSTMHNMKEDTKDAVHDTGIHNNNAEHGHLEVTDIQSVSSSCK
jgi:hypothetical protein